MYQRVINKLDAIAQQWKALAFYQQLAALLLATLMLYQFWCILPDTDFMPLPEKRDTFWLWGVLLLSMFILCGLHYRLAIACLLILASALFIANSIKIKLLHFPLIEQDIIAFLMHPGEMMSAGGITADKQYVLAIIGALVAGCIGLYLAYAVWRAFLSRHVRPFWINTAAYVFCATHAMVIAHALYSDYGDFVYKYYDHDFRVALIRTPDAMRQHSYTLTPLAYLAFSNAAARNKPMLLDSFNSTLPPVDEHQLKAAIEAYAIKTPKGMMAPDIVFVLAESTFDPNSMFELEKPFNNTLFRADKHSVFGKLQVSTAGGGTWKTEYETITGMISRVFGYLGEFTHYSLSSGLKTSFIKLLKSHGYSTQALYCLFDDFFGAKHAYRLYGFDSFMNMHDLKLRDYWRKFSDKVMLEKAIEHFPQDYSKPFFSYVVLLENHWPHTCKNFTDATKFENSFKKNADFEINCPLNEYLRRTRSTEEGYKKILQALKAREAKSKRPYILMIFGDHQPATFINDTYDVYKKDTSRYTTFFKIEASSSIKLPKLEGTVHAAFLPSFISTVFSHKPEETYLPMNLYVYDKCKGSPDILECRELDLLKPVYREFYK
jgi:phosphoglycerol transferase MdoB-like AlkP superfamily enzyme